MLAIFLRNNLCVVKQPALVPLLFPSLLRVVTTYRESAAMLQELLPGKSSKTMQI